MKNNDLLSAIGDVRDEWIEEAHAPVARRRRVSLLAAVLVMVLALSVGAFAVADTDGFYELLNNVAPSLAQSLKPVQLSCVDNGIELKVISADVQGDTARVFLGLRDLEGSRIDETCDLYDSYDINLPGDSIVAHCSFASFEPETQTALFVVELRRGDGKAITGKKFTFTLAQFLSGKKQYRKELELDAALAQADPQTTTDFVMRGYSSSDDDYDITRVLVPGQPLLEPVEGVQITAMGWVDGMLRIQAHYDRILETDNHGFITLADPEGSLMFPQYSLSFWDADHSGSYEEYLFRVTPEELENARIMGGFFTADQLHKGHWEITYSLE